MASSTARELRTGCRRGHVSALDALLYHCADGMYAMALSAVADEQEAQEVVRESWRRLLGALKAPRFERDPVRRLLGITERVIVERVGHDAARAARRAATADDGTVGLEGVRLAREVLEELSALSEQHADAIRARWRARRNVFRGALVALAILAGVIWTAVLWQRSRRTQDLDQLKYECLRERIVRQELVAVMRDLTFRLDDPTGADKETAADCERVVLVLEEIANSESLRQLNYLKYIRQRAAKHALADFVRSLEETFPETADTFPRVALALEEVQNL